MDDFIVGRGLAPAAKRKRRHRMARHALSLALGVLIVWLALDGLMS